MKNGGSERSAAWQRTDEIARMYAEEGLSMRSIGEKIGTSRETVRSVLREAGVAVQQKNWKPRLHVEEIRRLYVDEDKSITEIVEILSITAGVISKTF